MQKLDGRCVGISQGVEALFSHHENAGPMWAGAGPRVSRSWVRFDDAYQEPPSVIVTLSMWDLDNKTNARADVSAEKISATGFEIVFKTWGDTRIARARASWLAIGPVDHEDTWQLY